jgi:hypothetical protein
VGEKDYWVALEYRVCREFDRVPSNRVRCLWCDGFIPERYALDGPAPRVEGRAWICHRERQDEWEFVLHLPRPAASPGEVDWAALLPPDNAVRWLSLDRRNKRVRIEPAAAILGSVW